MLELLVEPVPFLADRAQLLLQNLVLKLHPVQLRLCLFDLLLYGRELLLVLLISFQFLLFSSYFLVGPVQWLLALFVLLLQIIHLPGIVIFLLLDPGKLFLQPLDQVKIGVGYLGIVDLDLQEVLLILGHDFLNLCILCLLNLVDLLLLLFFLLISDLLHPQLVLLLHVTSASVKLLTQLEDLLILFQLEHVEEVFLGNLCLFHFHLQGPLVFPDLCLRHAVVIFLQLERQLTISLEFYDLVLLIVP
mmetsp:Transcript_24742/g.57482  ORF Transcript_24742/g.57482 Transcript_24742/m.57482 type:complete len:247 (-) Transcript_24742:431-1171(-)